MTEQPAVPMLTGQRADAAGERRDFAGQRGRKVVGREAKDKGEA